MSHEQRSAISFELHLFQVVKNRSSLTAVIVAKAELRWKNLNNLNLKCYDEVFEGFIEDYPEDVEDLQSRGLLNFRCWE